MNYKSYSDKKKEYDNKTFLYIAKRLFEDLDETDAAQEDIIDGVGNVLKNPDSTNDWAFTTLDRLLLMMRQQLGEEALRDMLQHYQFIEDIDPLFIIERGPDYNYANLRKILGAIVTKVEDKSYLPEYLYHDDNEEFIEDDELNFTDKVRRAFTISTYLLYAIRNDMAPSTVTYDKNVVPSVELTFGIRAWGNCDEISDFAETQHSHPVLYEGIKEAILDAEGRAIHK